MPARTVGGIVGWVSALALALGGCSEPRAQSGESDAGGAPVAVSGASRPGALEPGSLPFDLDAVVAQVRFAFRRSDGSERFEGGHVTYAVEADARGLELRAFHASGETVAESDALRLEAELSRGDGLAPRGVRDAGVAEDGHLTIARGEVEEHLRNAEAGVEQSWSFARRPSGLGDLTVRVEVRGMRHVGTTQSGVHLADASGLGFRYGHGTWIDATGARTPVPARWARGAIELRVPADVVESAVYPAVLDPIISPEFGMDQPVMNASNDQWSPSVASNGSDYLVVWGDERGAGYGERLGTRVSASGAVLDVGGIVLGSWSVRSFTIAPPIVASNGTDYLVVWGEYSTDYASWSIRGTRVSAAGVVLDPDGLGIEGAASVLSDPSVASNGADYYVVWEDHSGSGSDVFGARVSAAGTVLDSDAFAISTAPGHQESPRIASNGTDYLVVWQDARSGASDVYGARVSAAGAVLDEVTVSAASSEQLRPSVASSGSDYLVVWQDRRSDAFGIHGARVSAAGMVDDSGLVGGVAGVAPRVASNGTDYLVVWQDSRDWSAGRGRDVYGARVSATGTVRGESELALATGAGDQSMPEVASNGMDYLVVWEEHRSASGDDVSGARVSAAGALLDPGGLAISIMASVESAPSVASNGTDYLVVWNDYRAGSIDIYGTRVSAAGTVLDPSGLAIATAAGDQASASVASNGTDYLVVWEDRQGATSDVHGARVDAAGVVLDEGGLAISTAPRTQESPRVASNGTDYLVVWQDDRSFSSFDVYGARVSAVGTVLDPSGVAISIAAGSQYAPRVASDGTDYLVVWSGGGVDGSRVSASGAVLDESGLGVSAAGMAPSVASNGADYLVVWHESRSGGRTDIYGARVSVSGSLLDASGLAVSTAVGDQLSPTVVSSDADYLVVWSEPYSAIYGSRVRAGAIESPDGIVFAADPSIAEGAPALAAGPPGQFLLVYQRSVPEASYFSPRVRARIIQYEEELGAPCRADAQCASGLCVDGVCCDDACGGGVSDDCQACAAAAGAAVDGTCGPTTGNACDDGAACTMRDVCAAGVCGGSGDPCSSVTTCAEAGGGYACSACPAGTYSTDGTGATACIACEVGTWSAIGATSCAAWTACGASEHESAAPTPTSDRECRACTVCGPGEMQSAPCTATSDAVCVPMPDAGSADAGSVDAGAVDAGAADAGAADAGAGDGGARADAGIVRGLAGGGCGCAAAGAGASGRGALALVGLAVALAVRRRRSR